MPPVSMTRAEYEKKYGIAPVAPPVSNIDTTPSPIRMSREEYTKTYGVTPEGKKPENNPVQNVLDRKPSFPANEDTSNPLGNIARTFGNIPSSAINLARTMIADPVQNFVEADKALLDIYKQRGPLEGTKDILGGFADTYLKAGEAIYGGIEEAYNALLDNPKDAVEKTSNSLAKIGIEDPLFIPSLLYGGEAVGSKDLISKIASPITRGADTRLAPIITKAGKGVEEAIGDISKGIREKQVADTADEIYAVEQNYSKARKLNQYATDGGSDSRARIARSNVLEGSVTTDGVIRTKQPGGAVERYRAETVDGYEDVVKKGLEREGSKANLDEVRRALVLEINRSGLEGADLVTAMNGIKKEIAGLARRADESGNVFLSKLQDAKIGTTRNINYQTPPETATYRKAVARAYKNTIENKSSLNVRKVNEELAKYYEDIERLEGLDGLRVKGGKLGKYTAQIAGNVGGGLVGGAIGGVPGAAVGTVLGGEITGALKGRALSESFGKIKKGEIPKSGILEEAKVQNELPKVVDLKTPDPVVGVRKDIPKTKEVIEIEAQIKNNVRKQKAAIKAGDFTLVEKLKEIYQALVEKLREVVKVITEKGPPQRGFIRIGGEGKDAPKSLPKSSAKSPSTKSTTEPETFKGYEDLSTKLLEKLKGRSTVSRQFISDLTNSPDLKQAEKDLIRRMLDEGSVDDVGDYAMSHRPSEGPPAHNLIEKVDGEQMIPPDMYDRWYGSRGTEADKESIAALKRIKDNPDAEVTIYGASPTGTFNRGDWVSFSKKYAQEHAQGNGTKVVEKKVKASDVRWAMDDVNEFGYYPPKSDQINVPDFANRVKSELLPLKTRDTLNTGGGGYQSTRYESINLPDELRGPVADYKERIYSSPIKTSAGDVHFSGSRVPNYFAHTRIEDLPAPPKGKTYDEIQSLLDDFDTYPSGSAKRRDLQEEQKTASDFEHGDDGKGGTTRRVIEIQSDLFQKGRLENEATYKGKPTYEQLRGSGYSDKQAKEAVARDAELSKLEPYRNTWHERVIREEVKQAAKDGKTKLQFPTGETAMKIEGLGGSPERWRLITPDIADVRNLGVSDLKVGQTVADSGSTPWIITDVLGDGKFKAVPKGNYEKLNNFSIKEEKSTVENKFYKKGQPIYKIDNGTNVETYPTLEEATKRKDFLNNVDHLKETFDISGKVDTENPIYKFYEKTVQKYLTNKYGGKVITDPQGVKWVEVDIKPEMKKLPIEAFGVAGIGVGAGMQDTSK